MLLMIAANYLYETFAESAGAKELSGSLALEDAMEIRDATTVPRDAPMGDGKGSPDSGAGIGKEIPPRVPQRHDDRTRAALLSSVLPSNGPDREHRFVCEIHQA